MGYFRQEKCTACHNLGVGPAKNGPDLATMRRRKDAAWMIKYFKNPDQMEPGSNMPPVLLSDANLNALAGRSGSPSIRLATPISPAQRHRQTFLFQDQAQPRLTRASFITPRAMRSSQKFLRLRRLRL